jgi:cytochrome c peroxidase
VTQLQDRRAFVLIRRSAAITLGLAAVGIVGMGAGGIGLFRAGGPTDALPAVPFPVENPFSEQKRILGKILFWDEQLSSDNTIACATCHQVEFKGTDPRRVRHPGVDQIINTPDDVFGSPGVIRQTSAENYERDPLFNLAPRVTNRQAQGVINSAYTPLAFWDGRASGTFIDPQTGQVAIAAGGALESQVVGPPVNDVEMAHGGRNWTQISSKLSSAVPLALATDLPPDVLSAIQSRPTYPGLFANAFGDGNISARRIAFAIATYERTLISDQTDFDAFQAGVPQALTPQENRGLNLFQGRGCGICHTPPLFSNATAGTPIGATFRNIGLRPPGDDPGRQAITGIAGDARRFKVPSLRNAGLKTSFMHTGQFTSVAQAVAFYPNAAAQFPQNRDPLIPIPIAPPDQADIVAFITGALTDPRVANAQFPFDHPTLFTGRPNQNIQVIGAGQSGTQNFTPAWIANSPPNIGNTGFKIGIRQGLSGAAARLRISQSPPVNNIVSPDHVIGPIQLVNGGPQERGYATGHWPIPAVPALDGRVVFMQWVIDDPGAPGGQSRTPPLRVELFCGNTEAGGCACYANCDQSIGGATLTANDFQCFLNKFAAQDISANCDGSTGSPLLTSNDFQCFMNAYASGCP